VTLNRRTAGVLHYVDTTLPYHGALKRCGLGSEDSQSTHKLSHGFSYAFARRVWHRYVYALQRWKSCGS
jgi:hypothetical protein